MHARIQLWIFPLLIIGALVAFGQQSADIYFFDCSGSIQRLSDEGPVGPARHVADIDTTLPAQVRDGCSIGNGWYDRDSESLVLTVQTTVWHDVDGRVPKRLLLLAVPDLELLAAEPPNLQRPSRPDRRAAADRVDSAGSPFPLSVAYLLDDGTTLLLQELVGQSPKRLPVRVAPYWRSGAITLQAAQPNATGRYALFDLATNMQLGEITTATGAVGEHRVVCYTPSGQIFLAKTRDSLLVLDVTDPSSSLTIGGLGLDLYWTACVQDVP